MVNVNGDIFIRRALPGDAPGLQSCMHSAYAAYNDRMGGTRLPPLELDYADEIENYPTWVATLEDQVVGGITMVFAEDIASIANVAVSPSVQGRGLGRILLAHAETNAKEMGCTQLRLATHVLLTENVDMYRHLGWAEFGRDDTRVFMKKVTG